jgi:Glycosyl hydrolase family 53
VSRSLSLAGLLLAALLLASPLPAHATEYQSAGTRANSPARSHQHGRSSTRQRCTARPTKKVKVKARRGARADHRAAAAYMAGCSASSATRSHRPRLRRPTSVLKQFPPHSVGDIFGVGSFVTQRSWTISPLVVGRARQLGTKWVREEFTASRLHARTSGRYWWTDYDRIVNQERQAGLQVLGLLDYNNTWMYHDHGTMPHRDMRRLVSDFARYAYDVARHFRGRVSDWEIWNEPNVDTFWHPTPDASDYATLLTAAGSAVKRADRRAKVVLAGTSGIDLGFIRAVAAHTHSFDVVAVHPYRSLPEPSFLKQVKALRGLHKPIWFSEIGWPAGDGCDICYGQVEQARYLVRFYSLAAAAGIQRVFWYDLRDDPHSASNPEAHFGLLRRDLSGKPAFAAYAYLSRLLDGSRYIGADWLGQHGLYTFRFRRGDTNISVLWNASDKTRQLKLKWDHPEADFITSSGEVLAQLAPDAGHVTVTAPRGGEPFYLVDRLPGYRVPALGALLHFAPPPPPPTPRPTPGKGRAHTEPTAVLTKAAWVAPKRQSARPGHKSASPRREHGVTGPKSRATITVTPSLTMSTPASSP